MREFQRERELKQMRRTYQDPSRKSSPTSRHKKRKGKLNIYLCTSTLIYKKSENALNVRLWSSSESAQNTQEKDKNKNCDVMLKGDVIMFLNNM